MAPRGCVFAPSPLLTVTLERAADGTDELHLHAGGQGFWIARLLAELGVDVVVCASFGGETGAAIRHLMDDAGVAVRAVEGKGSNGAYLHDRRSGKRQELASVAAAPLSRHEVDELYGATLAEALGCDVVVLGGPSDDEIVPASTYRRLATDLTSQGCTVVADLSGAALDAALAGGLTVLKVSAEELVRDGRIAAEEPGAIVEAMARLAEDGAEHVLVTMAAAGNLAFSRGQVLRAQAPQLEPVDTRGAGDSTTAGIAAALAAGQDFRAALRIATAAGALNVTRHGLATGNRDDIERFAERIEVSAVDPKEIT